MTVKAPSTKQIKEPDIEALSDVDSGDFVSIHRDTLRAPRLNLVSLLLIVLCAMALAFLGFLSVPVPDVYEAIRTGTPVETQALFPYTAQVPFALFLGAVLGSILGSGAILIFLATGLLFLPLFTNGGGLMYLTEPGFPYFIGMLAGAFFCGRLMPWAYDQDRNIFLTFFKLIGMAVAAVLIVHGVGILGLGILLLTGQINLEALGHWSILLGAVPILYDLALATALLILVRPVRYLLWLVLY